MQLLAGHHTAVIRDFHGSVDVYGDVLGFGAVYIRRPMPTFRRNIISPSSGLK
jgi:hypothetical protein